VDNRPIWRFVLPCVGYKIISDIMPLYIRAVVYSYVTALKQVTATRAAVVSTIIVNHCSSEALRSATWRQYIWREINTLTALCCEINLA
jgi:hypothetical protein